MSDPNALLRFLQAAQGSQSSVGVSTPSNGTSRNVQRNNNMNNVFNSPDFLMWQMAAQAQAQMLVLQQQQLQQQKQEQLQKELLKQAAKLQQQQKQQQQQPKLSFDDVIKKLNLAQVKPPVVSNGEEKKPPPTSNGIDVPSTSGATVTVKEGAEIKLDNVEPLKTKQTNAAAANNVLTKMASQLMGNKGDVQSLMWNLLASQLLQQQTALKSNGTSKPTRKDPNSAGLDITAKIKAEQANGFSSSNHHHHDYEPRSSLGSYDPSEHGKKRPPATEAQARVPLALGWVRQTCIRQITASGIRGDVVYYAPCGKKLSTYAEVLRYLMKNHCGMITRDNFSFSSKLIIGEFLFPKESPEGDKSIVKMREDEVNEEINKLLSLKPAPKNADRKPKESRPISPEEEYSDNPDAPKGTYDDEEKIKWSREPIDDLLLTEIRPLPEFNRVKNLELKGEGFADALMVFEFVKNFGRVLSIEPSTIPSLEDFVSGLVGDVNHAGKVLQLARVLFTLTLEYPGMPTGKKGRNSLGQSLNDVGVRRENFSELLRQFLVSRDSQGQKLAELLVPTSFEELDGEKKASILGFLCNELLCCRNIVKEIDNNLEEIGKLKGERWLRDGKARALRAHQKIKQKKESKHHHVEEEGEERPTSPHNSDSEDDEGHAHVNNVNKKLTPGLGQVEILTEQEENMSVEELEEFINKLKDESEEFKDDIYDLAHRVRCFPFGWDRFHRQYWQLPHVPTVLIEAIESAGPNNPACNAAEVCDKDPESYESKNFIDPDVIACLEDVVDDVVMHRLTVDKRRKRKVRRLDNPYKRGWWIIENKEQIESLRSSLHGRGIRERCLHRLLCKNWFMKDLKLGDFELKASGETFKQEEMTTDTLNRLEVAICELEHRIVDAQLQVPGFNPTGEEPKEEDLDLPWTYADMKPSTSDTLSSLRQRILNCEVVIEKRYLRQNFYAGETPSVARILGITTKETEEKEKEEEDVEEDDREEDHDNSKEDNTVKEEEVELVEKWRIFVQEAETTAQLMIALQCLDSSIAWERSISEARCQICKQVGSATHLLLCDGCQMGYHMQCFKPAFDTVPEGEWFCPRCKELASGKPTCVLCSKEGAPIYPCRKCYNFIHIECSKQHTPERPSEFTCLGCDTNKNFERKVIMRGESEERVEKEETVEPEVAKDVRRASKRKAEAPPPVVFPADMGMDLCRTMLDELEVQPSVGPFLEPVDADLVPGYRETIANPIDIATIRNKIDAQCYESPDDFALDLELMFNNCKTFNEDDSPVGIAGQTLQKFFNKRWRQVKYNYSKRLRRMRVHN